jgi:acetylornithine deacetylase/succinyl-diaminopimelate desuccinylase-like protein
VDERAALAQRCFDDALPVLCDYTRIECLSPSFDPDWERRGEIERAATHLAEYCRSRQIPGATVEVLRHEGRTPLLLVEVPGDASRGQTLIYGHLDKQPPLGAWREGLAPFEPVREGDRLYGRGTADDGYATFAAMAGIEALLATGATHGAVSVLIEASEESGSPDLDAWLDELAPRLGTPALVICLDSGAASYDRLWVTTSLRGVLVGTLTVSVLSEGVHSGHAGGIVPSSFRIARELLSRIEDERDGTILLPECNSLPPEHRVEEIRAVGELFGEVAAGLFPALPGLKLAGSDASDRILRGTWGPALEITGAAGLPAPGDAGNVLRPSTTLKFSLRLPPNVDAPRSAAALAAALSADPPEGAQVRVELEEPAQGWDAPKSAAWLADALEAASLEHFGAPSAKLGLGGSIPFMASLGRRYSGVQFLATGVLGPESNAHGPNEFLHLPTARRLAAVVADLLAVAP